MSNVKENTLKLLDYVKAFNDLKFKSKLDIANLHKIYFSKVPNLSDYIKVGAKYADQLMECSYDTEDREDLVFSVCYAEITKPPKVPAELSGWMSYKVNDFNATPAHYHSLVNNEIADDIEYFDDDQERVLLYDEYVKVWSDWKERELTKETARNVYIKLREMQSEVDATEATQELVVGNGLLTQVGTDLFYPIVTQSVRIHLDTKKNEVMVLCDADGSRIESLAIQQLSGIDTIDISKMGLQDISPMNVKGLYSALQEVSSKISIRQLAGVRLKFDEKLPKKTILFTMQPVFFIRPRTRAVGGLVDELKTQIEEGGVSINDFFTRLFSTAGRSGAELGLQEYSLEENLARSCGESKDILFTKPANKEQLQIAERIETDGVVVVQGPPGTGKTHTIANLIGNFLAEGKTVLVTSEKGKALSVLKNQLEKPLQPLCMYLNGENKEEAIYSIQEIQKYNQTHNSFAIQRNIDKLAEEREQEIKEIARIRRLIYQNRNKQIESIAYDGEAYSPLDATKFVVNHIGDLDYIPGEVKEFNAFPFSGEDLQFLYSSNENVSVEDEKHLRDGYPQPEELMTPDDFDHLIQKRSEKKEKIKGIQQELGKNLRWDADYLNVLDENGQVLIKNVNRNDLGKLEALLAQSTTGENFGSWMEQIILDGIKGGEYQRLWEVLIEKITEANRYFDSNCIALAKMGIKIDDQIFSMGRHNEILEEALSKMDESGKFGFCDRLFGRTHKYDEILSLLSIGNHAAQSKNEYMMILEWVKFIELAKDVGALWDQMMRGDPSVPKFADLVKCFSNPIEPMMKKVAAIQHGLAYKKSYFTLMQSLEEAGFAVKNVIGYAEWEDRDSSIQHEIHFLRHKLSQYLSFVQVSSVIAEMNEKIERCQNYLKSVSLKNPSWNQFADDFLTENPSLYRKDYAELLRLIKKEKAFLKRNELLQELRQIAPGWSKAIEERTGILGGTSAPESIYDAWKWKQLEKKINEINSTTVKDLEKELLAATHAMRQTTIQLCENRAWFHICTRINGNSELWQAMEAWQYAIKKLGKGTSQNAPIYKQRVKNAMGECQRAIPVWIMPFYMTYDFLRPKENHFDVIIVDEASQSDLTSVATLQLADKVIIVGDDKQVSPTNMSIPTEQIDKLRALSFGREFPKKISDVMDADSSLYNLALMQSNSIMLTEHFRCVPAIIGYSNWLSYNRLIKPLRAADSTPLKPAMVSYFVDGHREGTHKVNQKEAEYIVALLRACCENPAYADQTFGVISLLGREQAERINTLIMERISVQEKEKHQIVCGDAAQFQGDEKDIIFLSMVDSAEEGPLSYRAMDQVTYQQRYNVAVSRAKNQVWIVHSLHKNEDLKAHGGCFDIRRSLLEYAANPKVFNKDEEISKQAESPFEVEVCQYLSSYGFDFIQQYPAGAYRIDIAMKGRKVAVECDGDRWHSSPKQVEADMERQTILERLGWQFIRIRGTSFYRDKDGTMKSVLRRLEALKVFPQKIEAVSTVDVVTESIKTEAEKYVVKWENGEDDDLSTENEKGTKTGKTNEKVTQKKKTKKSGPPRTVKTQNPQETQSEEETNSLQEEGNLFGKPEFGSLFDGEKDRNTDLRSTKAANQMGKSTRSQKKLVSELGESKTPAQGKKGPITRTIILGKKQTKRKTQTRSVSSKSTPPSGGSSKQMDFSDVSLSTIVYHNKFGKGQVINLDKGKNEIRVRFAAGEKLFVFPDAFINGFLTLK